MSFFNPQLVTLHCLTYAVSYLSPFRALHRIWALPVGVMTRRGSVPLPRMAVSPHPVDAEYRLAKILKLLSALPSQMAIAFPEESMARSSLIE
jgi:hypothetical protein